MATFSFIDYWQKNYPDALPLGYDLREVYTNRWLRIHSLPASKRYAETEEEYQTILYRQNQLMEDLIGEGTELVTLFGLYGDEITDDAYKALSDFSSFDKVASLDLHQTRPTIHEEGTYLDIYIKIERWHKGSKDVILRAIADDTLRMLFICPSKQCIIAPYDGGVDVIVTPATQRDTLKKKYHAWLSKRTDGL
ncbi:MAG: hypothetical protein ACFB0B_16320 [Thermonemataceae bacterium]